MRAKIETILDDFALTIKYNTDISPEEAFTTAVDALVEIVNSPKNN